MGGVFAQDSVRVDRQERLVPYAVGSRRLAGFRNGADDTYR